MKIAFVYIDYFMKVVLRDKKPDDFSLNYYSSDEWGTEANSTERLMVTNFQAISSLVQKGFSIDQLYISEKDFGKMEKLLNYDLIVLNQTARQKQHKVTSKIIDFAIKNNLSEKIIFGTEVSWALEVKKGTYSQEQVDFVYSSARLLRHTAKTDQAIYATPRSLGNIIEFEIGLDCNLIKPISCITKRNLITFVCSPAGRVTKNNELIDKISSVIKSCSFLDSLEICKISPPYKSTDLWGIYENTKYFIFTSNSETFSYVLNDAKSKGCITLFPDHMYDNNISGKFTVVSYPESGIRYRSVENLIEKLRYLEFDKKNLIRESILSREYIENRFSVQKNKRNWEALFLGKSLNNEICYIYNSDYDSFQNNKEFIKYLNRNNIRFVIVIKNNKNIINKFLSHSFYDSFNDIVFHKYLYQINENDCLVRNIALDLENKLYKYSEDGQEISKENENEVRQFFRLFKRINKIRNFTGEPRLCADLKQRFDIQIDTISNAG